MSSTRMPASGKEDVSGFAVANGRMALDLEPLMYLTGGMNRRQRLLEAAMVRSARIMNQYLDQKS